MIFADVSEVFAAFADGLRPDTELTVSEWADKYRIIRGGAGPGEWRTDKVPYMREIMDRMSTLDPCRRVTLVKASQIAGSESANNIAGYFIDHAPAPMLFMQPREKDAINYSKERIAPMIEATPSLRSKVSAARAKDSGNTLQDKHFPGGMLRMCGANAPANLASIAVRVVIADEVDRFPRSAGAEGAPLALAEKRQTTFRNAKTLALSTPTEEGDSAIVDLYEKSDQRRYRMPCPHCGELQLLDFERLHYVVGDDGGIDAASVYVECEHSGCVIEERHKAVMLPAGRWFPSWVDDETGALCFGDPESTAEHYGYHISGLYSPLGWLSWRDLAAEFEAAKSDPLQMQVFYNTRLGLVWSREDGETVDAEGLEARVEDFGVRPIPDGVAVITFGADVQKDRIEFEVVGWGIGFESWSLEYKVIPGDTEMVDVWQTALAYLAGAKYATSNGGHLRISAGAFDTGYVAHVVYKHVGPMWHRNFWCVKGKHGGEREIWPAGWSRGGDRRKTKFKLIGVDRAKEHVYQRLAVEDVGPSFCHFPRGRDSWWFRQLTAEKKQVVTRNRRRAISWVLDDGARNEALDCRVYAYAALLGWESAGRSIEVAAASRNAIAQDNEAPAPVARRRRGGTLRRERVFR